MSQNKENQRPLEAAAIQYQAGQDSAPRIIGIGQGHVAEKMLEAAQEHDIPVVEDSDLSQVLQMLSIGDAIPEELYQVIAEVLVFIARLDDDHGQRFGLK